jgi:hypothetical protein
LSFSGSRPATNPPAAALHSALSLEKFIVVGRNRFYPRSNFGDEDGKELNVYDEIRPRDQDVVLGKMITIK